MDLPLVSVICLCHNQEHFVEEALNSIKKQTYSNIEIILVDDGSTDGSKEVIRGLNDSSFQYIDLPKAIGNCAAFNRGYNLSKGDYIIDLAADDVLLPIRVEEGINDFVNASVSIGVHFSDAFIINKSGKMISTHYPRDAEGQFISEIPQGNIYLDLIRTYFICPPTMMIRREVLDQLGGYDENLSFEDFDFWIRSSRHYHYLFNRAPLVKKRKLTGSHGVAQFKLRNRHQKSTLAVCQKIFNLNQNNHEDKALIARCIYEVRQCLKTLNLELIPGYLRIIRQTQRRLSSPSSIDK